MRSLAASILIAGTAVLALTTPGAAATGRPVQTERIPVVPEEVIELPSGPDETAPAAGEPAVTEGEGDAGNQPHAIAPEDVPEIFRGDDQLPEPVRELRQKLMAAARTGDLEQLRPIIESLPKPPVFSFSPIGDPIAYLASISGDAEGREILAILLEVLEAGYVHVDIGTNQEMYVWPYFARYPLAALTAEQMVEVFTLLTAGDFEDMKAFGAYVFFRLGIAPDGTWHFFVAGD